MAIEDLFIRKVREVLRVVDGDTFDFMVSSGYSQYVRVRIRLKDFDAAELSATEGPAARATALTVLSAATAIRTQSFWTDSKIYPGEETKASLNRWIGAVWVDDVPLTDLLHATVQAMRRGSA